MAIKILGDIVNVISEHITNPSTSGYNIFVGLEHYDSGEPVITRFGSTEQLESSVKHFKTGDILVARRNVYLKRAGVVNFEGVTSGDSIVLRIKEEQYKDIIPFILNTEDFWDYAEQNSDGTMSKRLAPDVLLEYECNIPDNHQQVAEKLWAAYKLKEAYKKMISTTDEMVKSQFIEMFGQVSEESPCLNDIAQVYDGTHKTPTYTESGIPFISVENISDVYGSKKYISKDDYDLYKHKPEYGDIFMTRIGSIGKCAVYESHDPLAYYVSLALIKPNKDIVHPKFLKYYIESTDGALELKKRSLLKAFPMKINLGEIGKIKVIVPAKDKQLEFVKVAEQADKSKFELRKSIESIDAVIKSLINS